MRKAQRLARGTYTPEALRYFAAMSVQSTPTRKDQLNRLIRALIVAGVWSKFDFFYILASHNSSVALINAKNPGTYNATAVSSPTFTVDQGYAGDGSASYLNTNFTPSTAAAGQQWVQDSAHFGLWSRTNAQSSGFMAGGQASSTTLRTTLFIRNASDVAGIRMNQGNTGVSTPASTSSLGHSVFRRSGASACAVFRNAASVGTDTVASTGLTSTALFIGGVSTAGTFGTGCTYQFAAAHGGASLTDQNITDTYNALNTHMTAIGA